MNGGQENQSVDDLIGILRDDRVSERGDVVYIRNLVWPWPVFEADVDRLHNAKFAIEEGECFYVCIFAADDAVGFLTYFWGVLKVAFVHFVARGRPLMHDAAERTPKKLNIFDAYNRVKTVYANDVFMRVAVLAVYDGAIVHSHFAVELCELIDTAETNIAVDRLCGHDGIVR